jgi:hypothetical protein
MNVTLGRASLAAILVLSVSGAALAREAGTKTPSKASGMHGIGFTESKFGSALRTGKDQPYTWPVTDRYRPVSQPYYGRAY